MLTRKGFLAALGSVPLAQTVLGRELGKPNAVFGVFSDIHVRDKASAADFQKALAWYREQDVDGVAIPGDLADYGQEFELKMVADAWRAVFPDGKGLNGKPVDHVMIGGNHEFGNDVWQRRAGYRKEDRDPAKVAEIWKTTWKRDPKGVWERCFGTPFEKFGIKEIKGYKFVYCHLSFEKEGIDDFLRAHAAELAPGKPFFYLQHCRIKGTNYPDLRAARDARLADDSPIYGRRFGLEGYPHAISLTGDTHNTLLDDGFLIQHKYTSINCASFRYTTATEKRAENVHWKAAYAKTRSPAQLPHIDLDMTNKQGMLFFLYDDHMVIERWDLHHYERAAPDLVLPLAKTGVPEMPYTPVGMKARCKAPLWPEGAKVEVSGPVDGRDRDKKPTRQMVVSWPAARNDDHLRRVRSYRIEAKDADGKVLATKWLVPKNFARALARLTDAESCPFALDELGGEAKARSAKFSVVAEGVYGNESAPL